MHRLHSRTPGDNGGNGNGNGNDNGRNGAVSSAPDA
jgi:hypothetical protein